MSTPAEIITNDFFEILQTLGCKSAIESLRFNIECISNDCSDNTKRFIFALKMSTIYDIIGDTVKQYDDDNHNKLITKHTCDNRCLVCLLRLYHLCIYKDNSKYLEVYGFQNNSSYTKNEENIQNESSNEQDEKLSCRICTNNYNSICRAYSMGCGHVMCLDCLIQHKSTCRDNNQNPTCPFCRKVIDREIELHFN